ncbi:MAG TPA: efflux RND transporter periplasmic adaptor subunit [Bacteroidales bacterium]|nr:efflux RND transporter periplasmic adaptor subunit [Bacteroidales bacterium]
MVLLFLLTAGCKQESSPVSSAGTSVRPVEVRAVIVQPRHLEQKITTTGSLLANEEVEVRPETSGRVIAIHFEEGSFISRGSLLVKIDDSELQAQLKKLQLEEKLAQDDLYRKQKLLEIKAVTEEEYQISQNQLGVVEAEIELVRSQIAKTSIYAPFSGYIGLRYVSTGGYASPSLVVARMQQTDPIKIEFTIPEKYINYIHKGSAVKFSVAGSENAFEGIIYALEPRIDLLTRSFTVRAKCPNPQNKLVPGAFAKVEIILQTVTDALVVPSEALIPDIRGEKVFLCREGKVRTQYVTTGIRTDYEVQVPEGLIPGDTVITTGILQLRNDMRVSVRIQESF